MTQKIVFLGGIHGVGKGTVCKTICSQLQAEHLSASELLKWNEVSADLKNKTVENILSTQDRLISGLNSAIQDEKIYLLDGHFCLLNKDNLPEQVPMETFKKIAPILVSVVVDDVNAIIHRLYSRDGKEYSFDTLNRMQQMEIDYAEEVSIQLNIPLVVIRNGDPKELIQIITKIF